MGKCLSYSASQTIYIIFNYIYKIPTSVLVLTYLYKLRNSNQAILTAIYKLCNQFDHQFFFLRVTLSYE